MVWTRGIEGCRERDFDDPKSGAMIGGHGYCTQAAIQGYPGVSRYVEMYLSKWEIHLSFRFIEFIYIIYIIYYSYYLVLNIF